jgi:hypothetical protein
MKQPKSPRSLDGLLEDRRLPDTCLAAQDEGAAVSSPRCFQQGLDAIFLGFPPDEHVSDGTRLRPT